MNMPLDIPKIISSDDEMNQRLLNIIDKDQTQWKKFGGKTDEIFKWLNNFSNKREIYLALILAENIQFYNLAEIRYLCNWIATYHVKNYLIQNEFPQPTSGIDNLFEDYIRDRCIFVPFGDVQDSASEIGYVFSHAVKISGLKYMSLYQFLSSTNLQDTKKVFLLDDFIGSGEQAADNWKYLRIQKSPTLEEVASQNPHIDFVYLPLVSCAKGKAHVESNTPIKVITGIELDDRNKCFSDCSIIYRNPEERREAKLVMHSKGATLGVPPLGYDDMELAIAFYHNTPDNSLPVIWRKERGQWYPLFERFEVR
jgi:hypothetical protein